MSDTRKFTPPTEFPAEYVNGKGERVTLIGRGRGVHPLVGQLQGSDDYLTYTKDGRAFALVHTQPNDLHDIPR